MPGLIDYMRDMHKPDFDAVKIDPLPVLTKYFENRENFYGFCYLILRTMRDLPDNKELTLDFPTIEDAIAFALHFRDIDKDFVCENFEVYEHFLKFRKAKGVITSRAITIR